MHKVANVEGGQDIESIVETSTLHGAVYPAPVAETRGVDPFAADIECCQGLAASLENLVPVDGGDAVEHSKIRRTELAQVTIVEVDGWRTADHSLVVGSDVVGAEAWGPGEEAKPAAILVQCLQQHRPLAQDTGGHPGVSHPPQHEQSSRDQDQGSPFQRVMADSAARAAEDQEGHQRQSQHGKGGSRTKQAERTQAVHLRRVEASMEHRWGEVVQATQYRCNGNHPHNQQRDRQENPPRSATTRQLQHHLAIQRHRRQDAEGQSSNQGEAIRSAEQGEERNLQQEAIHRSCIPHRQEDRGSSQADMEALNPLKPAPAGHAQ